MKSRYNCTSSLLKGNTHIHSTMSDGGCDYLQLVQKYQACHYDFICLTDHAYSEDCSSLCTDSFTVIPGIEIDGRDRDGSPYHIVGLDFNQPFAPDTTLENGLKQLLAAKAFVVLAHPHWSDNTTDDALKYPFDAVEVYNNVCHHMNGKSSGLAHFDQMLAAGRPVTALAVDDAHITKAYPDYDGGWIKVWSRSRKRRDIMAAIRSGNYFSSTGPDFTGISLNRNSITVSTSPVTAIRLVGPNGFGRGERCSKGELTSIEISLKNIPSDKSVQRRLRLEIEDSNGKCAWSNSLYV